MENSVETKVCKDCGRELPVDHFVRSAYGCITNLCYDCLRKKKKESSQSTKLEKLKKYASGDLLHELKRRGFCWEKMYVVEKKEVKFEDIE